VSTNILGQLVCGRNNDGSILVRCPNTYSDDNTNYAGVDMNKYHLRICQLLSCNVYEKNHIAFFVILVIDTNGNTSTRRCTGHGNVY
jgi:hypothetical protein